MTCGGAKPVKITRIRQVFAKRTGPPPSLLSILAAMFEISGTVKKIFEEQTFGSGFNKREFVLTVEDGRFPQDLKFECVKDKVALVAALKEGDKAKVFFDLRGREWKENYYVNLNAWKIETLDGAVTPTGADDPNIIDEHAPLSEPDMDEDVPF